LLWLWRRPAATAPIRPLVWESPYAVESGPKKKRKRKKKREREITGEEYSKHKKGKIIEILAYIKCNNFLCIK